MFMQNNCSTSSRLHYCYVWHYNHFGLLASQYEQVQGVVDMMGLNIDESHIKVESLLRAVILATGLV